MNRKKSGNISARLISAICILALCLSFFVGCSNDAAEEIEGLKNDLSTVGKKLQSLQSDYDEVVQEKETLISNNDAAANEIEALKVEKEASAQEIATLKSDNEASKQEIESLKSSNENSLKEIEELKGSNETALKEIESLKEQLSDLLNHITPDSSEEKIKIYIDQGHNPTGNHNSGAVGNGLHEENLTFTVGRLLAGMLALDGRFEVCLSRPTASTVLGADNAGSLEARVSGAKEFEADYFISLHVNSYTDASVSGIEIWVEEPSGEAYDLANAIRTEMIAATGLRDRGTKKDEKPLYVLKNATMPAILIEMGFISNPTDSALLAESPELFAQSIYDGILAHFNLQ